ncbi:MAG: hypothetical protein ABIO93_29890 [Dyadobacter sp.]
MHFTNTFIRLALLVASLGILMVGMSDKLQKKLNDRGWIPNQYRFGDLYNVTNLERFKELNMDLEDALTEADKPATRSDEVDLYTIGDSFTTMDTGFYAGNQNHHIWLGLNVETVHLNSEKQSILVIEVIERTIQERLKASYRKLYIEKGFQTDNPGSVVKTAKAPGTTSFWLSKFNDQINQRLEFLLFNSITFLKIKELKAEIMLKWFGRTHPGAVISRDHQFLFYEVEANPASVLSPFQAIDDASIDSVVTNMNIIRNYYRGVGFKEVYFCFIPNKVTVCEPDRFVYNNQISRIEMHPKLEVPVLSIQDTLRKHPEWFHKSDGHWNVQGKRLWLQTVNRLVSHTN